MTDGARASSSAREQPPHGSLAEEAAKLAEVAQQWLRDRSAPGAAAGGDDPWAAATDSHDTAPECRTCPICRARRLLRNLDPEVLAHLSDAAASVSAAVQAMSNNKSQDRPR